MSTLKQVPNDFALLGGSPAFDHPLPVGQLYFPSWERYEAAMRGIFERGWFTNHGPLAQELEQRFAELTQVRNAVTVTNATLGLVMGAKALGLTGKVVVPSFTFVATAQAMTWAGLEVVFADVDPETHQLTPATLAPVLDDDVCGVLAVNLWGGTCGPGALEELCAERGLTLFFDSAHGTGVSVGGRPLGGHGSLEVFSFHATKTLSATEGGCVCTDDDDLAARLRNIRSSYGAGTPVAVEVTGNGRFSEAQAAIALLNLDDLPANVANNTRLHAAYTEGLSGIDGIRVVAPTGADESTHPYLVAEVDEPSFGMSRDALVGLLAAENVVARRYFRPGVHRLPPYRDDPRNGALRLPATEHLARTLVQLPIGALVDLGSVERICTLVEAAHRLSGHLLAREAA
jgi:dTDP-4-amino-4,6-dideoxygalactose transaminase